MRVQQYKICPKCQTESPLLEAVCRECKRTFTSDYSHLAAAAAATVQPPTVPARPSMPANIPLIVAMWVLTASLLLVSFAPAAAWALFAIEGPAFLIALQLARSKNQADKTNGYAKLALTFVLLVVGFSFRSARSVGPEVPATAIVTPAAAVEGQTVRDVSSIDAPTVAADDPVFTSRDADPNARDEADRPNPPRPDSGVADSGSGDASPVLADHR